MKTILKPLSILLVLISQITLAQEKQSIAVFQDVKFAITGDQKRGYPVGTPDIIARLKLEGKQQVYGYFFMYPAFEYAEIEGIYKRYYVNAGYTLIGWRSEM